MNFIDTCMSVSYPAEAIARAIHGKRASLIMQNHLCVGYPHGEYQHLLKLSEVKDAFAMELKKYGTDYSDIGTIHFIDEESDLRRLIDTGVIDYSWKVHLLRSLYCGKPSAIRQSIRKKAREINERLWQIGLLREEVARMEVTPGEHHARRTIMRSVAGQNMKTVNLEIQKGDESAILKIETSALRCMDNSYYSPWRMDAPSRYKLVERFGRNTDVYPDDVVKITYGRKVLYERNAEVSKS